MVAGGRSPGVRAVPAALGDWWRSRSVTSRDAVLAVVVAAVAFVPGLSDHGVWLGELASPRADALRVPLILAQALPLVVRRTRPAVCLAVVSGAFAVDQAIGYAPNFAGIGLLVALYSVGAHQDRRRGAVAALATAAYAVLCVVLHGRGSPERPFDYVSFYLLLVLCWGAGTWMRWRVAAEAELRRRDAVAAVAEERARIARELHDVVTHHVTAIVVQADAARALLGALPPGPDPAPGAKVRDGLGAISGTGRQALVELRHLLGLLDDAGGGDPRGGAGGPGLDRLHDLVDGARAAGQPVELVDGTVGRRAAGRRLGPAADLAVYRVVQEGLTNAVKHAPGRPTTVSVRYDGADLAVDVSTQGPPVSTTPVVGGGGRGLAGLRDRLAGLGGDLDAGPAPDGGFVVATRFPVPEAVDP